MTTDISLPPLEEQAQRLIDLGVHDLIPAAAADLLALADRTGGGQDRGGQDRGGQGTALLVTRAPASALAPLLRWRGRGGFVVSDMVDLDDFTPIEGAPLPEGPAYLLEGVRRGDDLANWSPNEAQPHLAAAGRTPLTIGEGLHLLLQREEVLERGRCFMTIASRRAKPSGGLDARTPALWISNGTGRDGAQNKDAPKVGWCWAGNRHTWLGIASAKSRRGLGAR